MPAELPLDFLPSSHREAFKNIRNFLAGRLLGSTRDRALMDELFKCVFAKHWLIRKPELAVGDDISKSYRAAFNYVKGALPGIFLDRDEIEIDAVSLQYVDQQFNVIDIEQCREDIFSELYEAFAGSGTKSNEGQFFTPPVAVDLLVSAINPSKSETILDPACGAGGFLISAAKHLRSKGISTGEISKRLQGVDKDSYLTRIAKGRLALYLDTMSEVVCGDSLSGLTEDGGPVLGGLVDVILTNPPFGAKIVSANAATLEDYDLSRKWVKDKSKNNHFVQTSVFNNSTPPQVLFLERCIKLLKPGGRLGAILPESMVSSKSYAHVIQYLRDRMDLIAVIGMPEALFKTSGKGGTHTKTVALVAKKLPSKPKKKSVFFAEAKWCGHDSRGRQVNLNHIPQILENYNSYQKTGKASFGAMGVAVTKDRIGLSLAPRGFEFDAKVEAERLVDTHEILKFGDLVEDGVLTLSTGDEVGKLAYGTGAIPFIRTSDISNWELKGDPKHCVSEEIYSKNAARQDVCKGDIFMVRDGTYLIGTCAVVTEYDLPLVYQSHIYKIRVEKPEVIPPFLLLAALSSPFSQRQIKSFCVSQDIIDSLGTKIHDILLALPRSEEKRKKVAKLVEKSVLDRAKARELARLACEEVMAG